MNETSINATVAGGIVGVAGAQVVRIENLYLESTHPSRSFSGSLPPCPYPGLAYFGPEDSARFFGRDEMINSLGRALVGRSFTALVGASGSGKSSVVLAGFAPRLEALGGWRYAYFRIGTEPDKNPFVALARALEPLTGDRGLPDKLKEVQHVARAFETGSIGLATYIGHCRAANPGKRILLIADQFEEVFTLVAEEQLRNRFLDALINAFPDPEPSSVPGVFLLLTLRADFYSAALRHRPLADKLQDRVENLGPMTREELRDAIEKPARALEVELEAGLVEEILDDVEKRPGSLPLLQFALREMWGRLRVPLMTRVDYAAIGGVQGALAQRAQAIFEDATKQGQDTSAVALFRRLFTRLVAPGEGAEDTRRVVGRAELGPEAWALAQRLADEDNRLVVIAAALGQETVEVAHDALIRNWPTLVDWMNSDRAFLSWLRQLKTRIDEWRANPSDEGTLLRGGPLATATEWVWRRDDAINEDEKAYIATSIVRSDERRAAEAAAIEQALELAKAREQLRAKNFSRRVEIKSFWQIATIILFTTTCLLILFTLMPTGFRFHDIVNLSTRQLAGLVAGITVLSWAALLGLLYWLYPICLVQLHETLSRNSHFDEDTKKFDKFTFGAATVLSWIAKLSILLLGTSTRALDAWVQDHANEARARFAALPAVRERRIALDLPVTINGDRKDEPWGEFKRLFSQHAPASILITGPGGAGKTTLAFRVCSQVLGSSDRAPIGSCCMIPIVVESDIPDDATKPGGFYPFVAGLIRSAVNENRRISVPLATALIRSGRVLLVVDGLSERSLSSARAFDPQREGFEVNRILVTSRSRLTPGMTTIVETETIPARALFEFLDRYLEEMVKGGRGEVPSELRVLDACSDLKRLLRGTPCTPLLAAMWAQEIGAPSGSGKPLGVSGLIDNYIRRILLPSASGDEELIYRLTKDIAKIAERELADHFLPTHISRDDTIEIMRDLDRADFKNRLEVLERSQILKAPSTEFNIVRIEPDPIAEHRVARSYARSLGKNTLEWRTLLGQLRAKGSPRGFVSALAACAEDEVYGKDIPQLVRQQILSLRDGGESIKSAA